MDFAGLMLTGWALGAGVMVILWLIQRRTGNAGLVDVGWAGVTGTLAPLYALLADGDPARRTVLALLGLLWGGRLALYLYRDRVHGKPEEGRYVTLRKQWSPHADRAFFIFYQAQALAALVLSVPFALGALSAEPFPAGMDLVALALVLIGVAGESLADHQLERFKKDPASKGRTCRQGLWRYSRHPNYFFEWLHWFAYVCLAWGSPYFLASLIGPILMLISLCWVSGIPFVEAQSLRSRGDDYREYQRTTSALIPWFPKSGEKEKGKGKKGEHDATA
jgi:steroid 5-alpha reductase family enzyme